MLGMGVCSRPRNGELKWIRVVYQWCSRLVKHCETVVLLEGCSGVGPAHLSKRVIEMGWKQDGKNGTEEGVLTLVKLAKLYYNYK